MRAALDIARKDLRQKIRDRSAIFLSLVAPLGLAFLFSTMIPSSEGFQTTYLVVDLDRGPVAQALRAGPLQGLVDAGVATLETGDTEAAARARVEAGETGAAIVIPAGFSDAIQAGEGAELRVIGGSSALAAEIARSILVGFGRDVTAVQVAVGAAVQAGDGTGQPEPAELARLAQAALAVPAPIVVVEGAAADRQATSTTYYGASMAVLFVFFAAQFGVVGLLAERRTGTLARMLASPVAPSTILLGKVLVSLTLAVVSMGVIVVATTLLLRASWGDPLAVAALILATAIAATGIATLVVGFARTEEQAGGGIAIVALSLAVLGGSFFPVSQAPEGLAAVSLVAPHAWFLKGVNDLAGGGGIETVVGSVAALLAVGVVTGGLGLARARRVVVP
jgi:ABC-2 type transport system permease protein